MIYHPSPLTEKQSCICFRQKRLFACQHNQCIIYDLSPAIALFGDELHRKFVGQLDTSNF